MTALTQYLSDLPGREDGEKVGDARSRCEHCQLAFVQLSNVIERHIRLLSQGCDGSLVPGTFARRRGQEKPVHTSLSSEETFPRWVGCFAELQSLHGPVCQQCRMLFFFRASCPPSLTIHCADSPGKHRRFPTIHRGSSPGFLCGNNGVSSHGMTRNVGQRAHERGYAVNLH